MSDKSKKVEVKYGSFTCSIEGYDNPVEQLREILGLMQNMISETPQLAEQAGDFDASNVEDALSGGGDQTPGIVVIRNADESPAPVAQPLDPEDLEDIPTSFADSTSDGSVDSEPSDILVVGRPTDAMDTIDTDLVAEIESDGSESSLDAAPSDFESDLAIEDDYVAESTTEVVGETLVDDDLGGDIVSEENETLDVDETETTDVTNVETVPSFSEPSEVEEAGVAAFEPADPDPVEDDDASVIAERDLSASQGDEEPLHQDIDTSESIDVFAEDDEPSGAVATLDNENLVEDDDAATSDQQHDDDDPDPSGIGGSAADLGIVAAATSAAGAVAAGSNSFSSWGDRIAGFVRSDDAPAASESADVATPSAFGKSERVETEKSLETVDKSEEAIDSAAQGGTIGTVADDEADQDEFAASAELEGLHADAHESPLEDDVQSEQSDDTDAGLAESRQEPEKEAEPSALTDTSSGVFNIFAAHPAARGPAQRASTGSNLAAASAPEPDHAADTTRPAAAQSTAPVVNIFGAPAAAVSDAPEYTADEPEDAHDQDMAPEILEAQLNSDASTAEVAEPEGPTPMEGLAPRPDEVNADSDSAATTEPIVVPEIFGNMPDDVAAQFASADVDDVTSSDNAAQRDVSAANAEEVIEPASAKMAQPDLEASQNIGNAFVEDVEAEWVDTRPTRSEVVESELVDAAPYRSDDLPVSGQVEIMPPDDSVEEPQTRNSGFNIFAAPPTGRTSGKLKGFSDSFSSDLPPAEPPVIDLAPEEDSSAGPRPPWERPDGPMPDYSASARVRAGLDPFPKAPPKPEPTEIAVPETSVSGVVLSENQTPKTESQSRFQALLKRVNNNVDDDERNDAASPVAELAKVSATELAARAESTTTADLLAASAAWLTLYKDSPQFTRREVMQVFDTIPGDHQRTLEARIKGYGKLLRAGTIQLVDDGVFSMSHEALASFEALARKD